MAGKCTAARRGRGAGGMREGSGRELGKWRDGGEVEVYGWRGGRRMGRKVARSGGRGRRGGCRWGAAARRGRGMRLAVEVGAVEVAAAAAGRCRRRRRMPRAWAAWSRGGGWRGRAGGCRWDCGRRLAAGSMGGTSGGRRRGRGLADGVAVEVGDGHFGNVRRSAVGFGNAAARPRKGPIGEGAAAGLPEKCKHFCKHGKAVLANAGAGFLCFGGAEVVTKLVTRW